MKFTYFFIALAFYISACVFAQLRDFGLSMGLAGAAAFFAINSYLHYKKEKVGVPKMKYPPPPPPPPKKRTGEKRMEEARHFSQKWHDEVKGMCGQSECTCENYAITCDWCMAWDQKLRKEKSRVLKRPEFPADR